MNPFTRPQKTPPTFKDLWKILTIEDGTVVTQDPYAVTAVCYFPPFYLKDSGVLEDELSSFVRSLFSLPTGSTVSVYLVKQFKDYDLPAYKKGKHAVMNFLEDRRMERLNAFPSPEYQPFFSITLPLPELSQGPSSLKGRVSATVNKIPLSDPGLHKGIKAGMDQLDSVIGQIKSRFAGALVKLSTEGVMKFLGLILNHSNENTTSDLSSLLLSDTFSRWEESVTWYGGNFHTTLSLRTDGFPQNAAPDFSTLLYSEELKAIPFLVKASLLFPDPADAKRKANAMVSRINVYSGIFQKLVKDLMVQKGKLDQALLAIEEEGGRLLDLNYVVHTWAPTAAALDTQVKTLTNVFRGKELILKRDDFNHKATYHALPPFAGHLNKISTRIISMNAEPFLPLLYPPFYRHPEGKPPELPTYFHNTHDVLMSLDLMDPRDPSWNGIICGGSGSGKSFLTNYLIMNHLKGNGKVFLVDKGGPGQGSFRNLVLNLPTGRYIELRFVGEAGFTVNFFDGPLFIRESADGRIIPDQQGTVDAYKESFLLQVLTLMCLDDAQGRLSKTEEGKLSESIREAYLATNNNEGNVLTLESFAETYMMERFHSLYDQMSKYIENGIYARFFRATTAVEDVDVFCFDLEGLSEHPDLETILTLIITRFTYDLCIRNRGFRKMVILDEAWAQLSGGGLTATVEGIWRTIRKHGGNIYCVTQSYDDIIRSKVGPALLANTTHFFMCGASHSFEALSHLKATGSHTHTIDEYDYKCIQELRFNPPEFADYYMMTPVYKGTLRLRPSPRDEDLKPYLNPVLDDSLSVYFSGQFLGPAGNPDGVWSINLDIPAQGDGATGYSHDPASAYRIASFDDWVGLRKALLLPFAQSDEEREFLSALDVRCPGWIMMDRWIGERAFTVREGLSVTLPDVLPPETADPAWRHMRQERVLVDGGWQVRTIVEENRVLAGQKALIRNVNFPYGDFFWKGCPDWEDGALRLTKAQIVRFLARPVPTCNLATLSAAPNIYRRMEARFRRPDEDAERLLAARRSEEALFQFNRTKSKERPEGLRCPETPLDQLVRRLP